MGQLTDCNVRSGSLIHYIKPLTIQSNSSMLYHLIQLNPNKDITLHVSVNNPAMVFANFPIYNETFPDVSISKALI